MISPVGEWERWACSIVTCVILMGWDSETASVPFDPTKDQHSPGCLREPWGERGEVAGRRGRQDRTSGVHTPKRGGRFLPG